MNSKNKIILSVVAVLAIVVIIAFGIKNQMQKQPEDGNVIKIAAILPLTGAQAVDGQELSDAISLAAETLNELHKNDQGHRKIQLLIEDSQLSPKTAITVFNKLMEKKPSAVIVGGSTIAQTLAPLVDKTETPLFCLLSSDEELPATGKWIFRFFPSDKEEVFTMADYAKKNLNINSIYLLSINNIQGENVSSYVESAFAEKGIKIVGKNTFAIDETNPRSTITNAFSTKPDAFYIFGYGPGYCTCFNVIRELGFTGPILTWDPMSLDFYQNSVKQSEHIIYYTAPKFSQDFNQASESLYKSYKNKYNKIPGFTTSFGYESIIMIDKVFNKAADNKSDLLQEILNYSDDNSSTGKISFDRTGGLLSEPSISTLQNSEVKLIQ